MDNYERIAEVIRYLDEHQAEQPDLATLARQTGLSPFHFHRLFSSWAGITPKDFLQCLTASHARQLLRSGRNVLDSALDVGLSGPGRLHDLCVTLESAAPGELRSGGEQWTITAGFAPSPFGICLIASGPRGICHLSFIDGGEAQKREAWQRLLADWPRARIQRNDADAKRASLRIFVRSQKAPRPSLRAFVRGTPFQIRVWRALLAVPPGRLVTYGELAANAGAPAAARATGTAVGQNPLAYLIPCHRVIRETGVIGNYRWDPIRKKAMLAWESGARRSGNGC